MHIYRASSKEKFLQEIVNFTDKNYANDFSNLKIILPTGLLCNELQKTFIENFNTSILPTIIPFSDLVAESEEVFKIPSEQIGCISKLEERITLATTIHSYKQLGYNLSQSLRLAPSLANLFFELETNDINLQSLKNLPALDQPEHWHIIYDFLCYASETWENKIRSLRKMTRASYQKLIFETELTRLKNNKDKSLILAGVTGDSLISNNFIKNASTLNNVKLILPPYIDAEKNTKLTPEHALYKIDQIINLLEPQVKPINLGASRTNILDKLLTPTATNNLYQKIDYLEFDNIFHEAEYIALQCAQSSDKKIAIIVHEKESKEQYCTLLTKYDINYHDLWGDDILKQPVISFILLVSEYFCCEFNLKNFFAIISHPLLNSSDGQNLENIIRKKNRLASSLEEIGAIVNADEDDVLKDYYEQLSVIFKQKIDSRNFADIFKNIIKFTEILIPNIWDIAPAISTTLAEINRMHWQLALDDIEEFPEILKQLLEGGRISHTSHDANITICRAQEAAFINYDLVIISNLNDGVYPAATINNAWLNSKMQKELDLDKNSAYLGKALYDFYLNLQNTNILLTRSKKQSSNKQSLPSPFLLHLMHILGDKLQCSMLKLSEENTKHTTTITTSAKTSIFPSKISATDVETLIRAPYNFYAKKILCLKKIDEIDERPNLAEFGNFFHAVVEQYTENYNKNERDKELSLIEIAKSILKQTPVPNHSKKTWLTKFTAIAPEFIQFDEDKRKGLIKTHSEIKGELKLNILDQEITILAIADRIDINKDNTATILDYKTGTVPSQKDVLSGLSPQLLIEAIILSEGGFAVDCTKIRALEYVKINSSKPYITTTEITLTPEDLLHHKQGLITLLEYYVKNMEFIIEPNLMKYDNYRHLARRL